MLDGGGAGNVVTVTAPDVTVRGVTVRGSGRDLQAMNSGIFLEKTAERATVENNRLVGNLFGVYVHGAAGSRVAAQRDRRASRRPPQRGRQRRLALERARRHHCRQHLPLRPRRHLHDFQPQGPLRRQPLRAGPLRGPLHVHQRQRSQRQRLGRQPCRLRHHVLEPAGDPRQHLRSRPRPRACCSTTPTTPRSTETGSRAALWIRSRTAARAPRRRAGHDPGREAGTGTARPVRKSASSSTTPTTTGSGTTGSNAAPSASISPPGPKATKSPATPSSATATR